MYFKTQFQMTHYLIDADSQRYPLNFYLGHTEEDIIVFLTGKFYFLIISFSASAEYII